jgi:dTDP-4-dehydrorhamnose 3,5-epimerase
MMHAFMKIHITRTPLADLLLVNVDFFKDERGFFMESWNKKEFAEAGLVPEFVQDSHSASTRGVLRGMHYQDQKAPMAKLIRCTVGRILDVAIDLRMSSATFGKWYGIELSSEEKTQVFVPEGFAHGFLTLSDYCEVQYKQTALYHPEAERGIAWDDPSVGVSWPIASPLLSKKDQRQESLSDYRKNPAFQ